MKIKTGELKAKLSAYLHRVQEEGVSYVVCDRERPVALLCPLDQVPTGDWARRRQALLAQARAAGLHLTIPSRSPVRPKPNPQPATVSGKTPTVQAMRAGKDW
jgi:antitoxin (DNA-binding transcriptional repressor) of toxin-antitoxin stability system